MHQRKFYRLIIDSRYRIWRHLLFIFTLSIITFNQVFIAYQDAAADLGYRLYFICFVSFTTYLASTYFHYFFLIPKLLLREKYVAYLQSSVVLVILLIVAGIFLEYAIRTFFGLTHRMASYTNPLILVDSLSNSMITIICFWSMSVVRLLRKWNNKNEHIVGLEYKFLESEVNKLKGQVSPIFLSKALKKAASLTKSDPEKASTVLMQLSHLLRYQLYDCDREMVFLHSEISFIGKFLKLNELLSEQPFEYALELNGLINNLQISPLLLIVLIQNMLKNDELKRLHIAIAALNNTITCDFNYADSCTLSAQSLAEMSDKLNTLYPNLHTLTMQPGHVHLQLNVT